MRTMRSSAVFGLILIALFLPGIFSQTGKIYIFLYVEDITVVHSLRIASIKRFSTLQVHMVVIRGVAGHPGKGKFSVPIYSLIPKIPNIITNIGWV